MPVIDLDSGNLGAAPTGKVQPIPQQSGGIIDLDSGEFVSQQKTVTESPETVQSEGFVQPQTQEGRNLYQSFQDWQKRTGRQLFERGGSLDKAIESNVIGRAGAEAGAGIGRSLSNFFDSVTTAPINETIRLAGGEDQFFEGVESFLNRTTGMDQPFMEEGLARDIVKTSGELAPAALGLGSAARTVASKIPAATTTAPTTTAREVARQLGTSTAAQDVGFSALSAAGGEIGEEAGGDTGKLVGSILAPTLAAGGQASLKRLISAGNQGIQNLTKSVAQLSDDGAATLLAEQMMREGLSPDDVSRRIAELGTEAIPADVGNSFGRLLRAASNKIPQLEGRASQFLNARQAGSADRVNRSLSHISSLNAEDEIARLSAANKPKINELYDSARSKAIELPARLRGIFKGDNSVARASRQAEKRLSDRRALGEKVSNIDLIDETKRVLDDQIGKSLRNGENNKVRDLVKLKNFMVGVADDAIPEYKQARDLFAGQRQLENATDAGRNYFRLNRREVSDFVKSMGESELNMFRLGAKEAIEDKIYDINSNSDVIRRLFSKNGDIQKLSSLFPNRESFNDFVKTMERESQFSLTRRAAQGGSTTVKQASDIVNAEEALGAARAIMGDSTAVPGVLRRILTGLQGKRNEQQFIQALEQAGDILLESGMNPQRLQGILRKGSKDILEKELTKVLVDAPVFAAPTARASALGQVTEGEEDGQ